ncbi:putative Fungal-specific transcription factor domain-containing protein [Seiridium cardinale]|uniref:Fungal-specific transcription factor domain-containing protein n=1 Tax=Seiridium cardinale TaxID=138064 RepID=A0ABR2Y1M7_9PEZI
MSFNSRQLIKQCNFDDKDDKVVVTRAYLLDLQRNVARSVQNPPLSEEGGVRVVPSAASAAEGSISAPPLSGHEEGPVLEEASADHGMDDTIQNADDSHAALSEGPEPSQSVLTNPLVASPSTYTSASSGRPFYLGTSSNWSFCRRILQMTHEHVRNAPLPSNSLLFDGMAYDVGWRGPFEPIDTDPLAIPSPDYAIYLINAVKFHCGQMFHLFDDDEFHHRLQQFYSEPDQGVRKADLWYIHFLLILAFGKIFIMQKSIGKRPSGIEFFLKAMEILPPAYILCHDPIAATEILCCIALYLQCIDHRHAAHIYIGQAIRTALSYGMHTDMPVAQLGEGHVQRCRKIWWTIYVLDRQMTSLMGEPQSIQDGDIHCQLPVFHDSNQRTTTLDMHIKLARVIAEINNSIYGVNGRLNGKFLNSTKALLKDLAGLATELGQALPLKLDNPGQGVSRISASLHLLYHQCIVLATRPLMFCYLKMRFESATQLDSPTQHRFGTIIQMCIESAQQIINILESLHSQGLLEAFLSSDLDSLHVSSIILVIGSVVDEHHIRDRGAWVQRCLILLDCMMSAGNLIAGWRKSEMQQLDEMVTEILSLRSQAPYPPEISCTNTSLHGVSLAANLPLNADPLSLQPFNMHNIGNSDDFSADQIMAIASSIQEEDVEWMDRAIAENSIW